MLIRGLQTVSTSVILFVFRVVSHHILPIPRPFLVHSYRFPMLHVHALLPPNCYIDLICYLDVDSVTGDVVSRGAYCGEVSLTLD